MDVAARLGSWSVGPGPLHRKLASALPEAMERGDLAPGTRLPAERSLARSLAVSRSTVVAAYDRLRSEGWLESRQGSGTRVRWSAPGVGVGVGVGGVDPIGPAGPRFEGSGDVIFRRLIEGPGTMISLAAAILPGAPEVAEAAASFSGAELADLVASPGYVPLGLPALRREIAALHTRAGLPTTENQILVTTGAQQAISLAATLLVRPGDTVLVENPSFSGTLDALRTVGARLVPVPIDEQGVDVEAFARLVEETEPAAAYLMPSFHNPTGVLLPEHRRRRLTRLAAERDLPIIEDNALEHARFAAEAPPRAMASFEPDAPVLTVGSLSKVLWAGLRVGWVRASEETIGRLVKLKVVHDLGSPVLPQAIAARLLPDLEAIEQRRAAQLSANLDHAVSNLKTYLPEWTCHRPEGGLALWVRLPAGDGSEFCQVALRHGVEVVPGTTMSPDRSFADYLRLAIMEPAVLDEAFARLARAWAAYAPDAAPSRPHLRGIV
jgi:DNA-binding transcriptional MocR family regulator